MNGDASGLAVSTAPKRPIRDTNNSAVTTPARIATPPPPSERTYSETRGSDNSRHARLGTRATDLNRVSAFDADAVDHALRREMGRQQRDSTPGSSPHRKRQRINGDRYVLAPLPRSLMPQVVLQTSILIVLSFIPTRSGQDLQASFSLLHEDGSPSTPSGQKKRTPHGELHFQKSRSPDHLLTSYAKS